ncbi:MAG: hypothetical protein ISS70_09240 [Phycisphaerae bacterium]|nr:hypothetical protein [Phycisphaerae bacterium]
MGILARLFNFVPRRELKGVSLGRDAYWEISGEVEFPSLLRALLTLVPENAILYLEGGTPPKDVRVFLGSHCIPEVTHLAMGTIWPRPLVFHLPATSENLCKLAELAEKCSALEIAIHLHVYKAGEVLLEWYDAFFDDPMYLSRHVPEDNVRSFSSELSLKYKVFDDEPGIGDDGPDAGS